MAAAPAAVLMVRIGPMLFALDLARVAGLARAPGGPPPGGLLAGRTRFQREEIAVLHLHERLGFAPALTAQTAAVVEAHTLRFAILVDGVVELATRGRPEVLALPEGLTELPPGSLPAMVRCEGLTALLLDVEALLPMEELMALGEALL